ncbi:Protein FAM227B [Stylophora pistillata]|uniref:Protein FAM227B n=1 Tax=Stylophora pistillata TaxID=50429 RepID=A0A2B4SAY3_STYPI|nr:Protein FAM227B [Stylophora pistillata]
MDPRIQAILAKYENEENEEAEKHVDKPTTPEPPKTLEQWLERRPAGSERWPDDVDSGKKSEISVASVGLGSLEEIMEDLGRHACILFGWDFSFFYLTNEVTGYSKCEWNFIVEIKESIKDRKVSNEVEELEKKLAIYASQVLTDKERPRSKAETMSPATMKALQTSADIPAEVINKKEKVVPMFTSYPGFFPTEVTPLPGQLEAPQLLNRVTKSQQFPSILRKRWKKMFLSEGSVTLLQDTFWWFFLEKFQPDCKKAQDGLFNRIADSFVALFFGVSPDFKDKFFQYFPDCLAQAVYASYCEVFPRSYQLFDDDFKSFLLNTISEWVTGTRPPPYSWKKWNLKLLEPGNIRELQDDRTQSLKANMSFDLDLYLDDLDTVPASKEKAGTHTAPYSPSRMGLTIIPTFDSADSHEVGPGPEFERVGFNLLGRSPLVSHFLRMKELTGKEELPVQAVGRTEVAKLPVLETSEQESLKIQKQKRAALAKLERIQFDCASCTSRRIRKSVETYRGIDADPRVPVTPVSLMICFLADAENITTKSSPAKSPSVCLQGSPGLLGRNGINGRNGLPGRDGRDGTKGEKGVTGRHGLPGLKGEPGASISIIEYRNWKQCAWREGDSKDIGLVKA